MKGAQRWACTGLTELSLGINKHRLKETGWQKMRDGRGPSGDTVGATVGLAAAGVDEQESPCGRRWAEFCSDRRAKSTFKTSVHLLFSHIYIYIFYAGPDLWKINNKSCSCRASAVNNVITVEVYREMLKYQTPYVIVSKFGTSYKDGKVGVNMHVLCLHDQYPRYPEGVSNITHLLRLFLILPS